MKKSLFVLLASLMLFPCNAITEDDVNGVKAGDAVIFNGTHTPRLIECEPEGWYYHETRMLTIEFPATGFEPYTLSVESDYNALDYYVTTPFMSLYISPNVTGVNIYLETDGGDLYWGSFEASSSTSME